jgi:hypothetical protein
MGMSKDGTDFVTNSKGELIQDDFDYFYFALGNTVFLGYGDIVPVSRAGKLVVSLQLLVFWSLVVYVMLYY